LCRGFESLLRYQFAADEGRKRHKPEEIAAPSIVVGAMPYRTVIPRVRKDRESASAWVSESLMSSAAIRRAALQNWGISVFT
jgi:hypothetical protein